MGRTVSLTTAVTHNLRLYDDDTVVDDLIRLSTHQSAKAIWKLILERNNVQHCKYLCPYSGAIPEELVLWLCSLDYSNGTATLQYVAGKDFVSNCISKFLLLANTTAISDDHMINGNLRPIYESLLNRDMLQYLKLTEKRRCNSELYSDHIMSVCNTLLLSDIAEEDILYLHYYMSIHSIDVTFTFTKENMLQYAEYAFDRKGPLTNVVNNPYYRDIIEHLEAVRGVTVTDLVDKYSLLESNLYSPDCYEYILSKYAGDKDISAMDCSFVSGIHLTVYLQLFNFDRYLSVANLALIEDYVRYNYIVYEDKCYLCWRNMSIDCKYIETLLECTDSDDDSPYVLQILTSNVKTPLARELKELCSRLSNVTLDISYDYYNTPTNILYDFIQHGYYDQQLKEQIVRNNHTLLCSLL